MNVETIRSIIYGICDKAESVLDGTVSAAPHVIRAILDSNPITKHVPGFLKDRFVDLLMKYIRKFVDHVRDVIAYFRDIARRLPSPDKLRAGATALADKVRNPAHVLGTTGIDTDELKALRTDNWDSSGRDSYERAVDKQPPALKEIESYSTVLETLLKDMADAWEAYFDKIRDICLDALGVVLGLAAAIVTAVETFGVGAVLGIIASVVSLVKFIVDLIDLFNDQSDAAEKAIDDLSSATAIGSWPETSFAGA